MYFSGIRLSCCWDGRNKFVSSNWVVGMLYYRFSSVISKKGINLLHINLSYLYYDEYKSKIITDYNMVSSASDTTSFFLKNSLQNIKKRLVLLALSLMNIMTFVLPFGYLPE